jgi:tRNA-(ms[2]io[6]A)-hydroxylase
LSTEGFVAVLHLQGSTSTEWLETALAAMDRVLVDHAHCEHKAAVTALAFVSKYPDDPRLVTSLGTLARDEAGHFARLADLCIGRGLTLGHPEKDPYVDALLAAVRRTSTLHNRVDRLLCCAIIEGRSCERMKLLAGALPAVRGRDAAGVVDDAVCALYDDLWREEATHHLLFVELAERSLARAGSADAVGEARQRLAELAAHEGALVARLPVRAAIH